jgi:hypothetical protein
MKRKEPTVLMIDVDGVLADFSEAFTRTARGLDNSTPIISTVSQPTWNLKGFMSPTLVNQTWELVRQEFGWWKKLHPLIDEKELQRLRHYHTRDRVVFCTGRSARNPEDRTIEYQTIEWLEVRGLRYPSVLCSSKKGEVAKAIGATYSIEDKPENAAMVHWLTDGKTKSFILDRPYNREFGLPSGVQRVGSLGEFFDAVDAAC